MVDELAAIENNIDNEIHDAEVERITQQQQPKGEEVQNFKAQLNANAKQNQGIQDDERPKSACDIWTEKIKNLRFWEVTQEEFEFEQLFPSGKSLTMLHWMKEKVDNWRFVEGKMPFGGANYLYQKKTYGRQSNFDLYKSMENAGALKEVLDHTDYKEQQEDLF